MFLRTEKVILPTAPRAALNAQSNEEKVPFDPPFTAYVANLPYDCREEDVMDFFSHLNVKSVRLIREDNSETGRLKARLEFFLEI